MAAEVLQQVAGGVHGRIDVEALYGARRTGGKPVGEGKHNRRLVVKLGKA